MNCQFCSNKVTEFEDGYRCYICDFSISHEHGTHIKWQRELGSWSWALNIYPNDNKSVLWGSMIDCKSEVKIKTIKIPYTVKSVTPDNVIQKIKTILIFQ